MELQTPRIAIIGGGPAGLTCARILQLHGLRPTIFEYEKSAKARSQAGGSLDLHPESGMLAMKEARLVDQFYAKARPEGNQVRILDKDAHVLLDAKPDGEYERGEERPEIDRSQLREILLESLDEGTIQWGRKLVKVEDGIGSGGSHMLVFEDSVREEADLVIGADGAWSKVRPLLSEQTPEYCGVTFIDTNIENVDDRYPKLGELVGDGTTFMLSPDRGLIAQRNSNGKIRSYVVVRVEEGWAKEFAEAQIHGGSERARELLLSFFDGWSPELLDFIRHCDDEPIWARPIYALPAGHSWTRNARSKSIDGITLMGDAAHVMSPFAGEGVNLAMLDARELAMALVEAWNSTPSVESLRGAIPAFQQAMCERAEHAARMSDTNLVLALDERAPHGFLEVMVAFLAGGGPPPPQ